MRNRSKQFQMRTGSRPNITFVIETRIGGVFGDDGMGRRIDVDVLIVDAHRHEFAFLSFGHPLPFCACTGSLPSRPSWRENRLVCTLMAPPTFPSSPPQALLFCLSPAFSASPIFCLTGSNGFQKNAVDTHKKMETSNFIFMIEVGSERIEANSRLVKNDNISEWWKFERR